MKKWLVGRDTSNTSGPSFRTKREAIEYGRLYLADGFIVWKRKTT